MNPNGAQGQQPHPQQGYQQQPAQPQPYQQQGYQPQGYPGAPVQLATTGPNPVGGGLVALGGLVAAIAAFLAWVSLSGQGVTVTVSGTGSVSGADVGSTGATDGWITFGAGVVVLIVGALALARKGGRGLQVVAILAGVVVAGVPIYDLIKNNSDLQSLKDQGVDVSYSIGIWLTIVGGVVIVLGAIIAMIGARKQN
ncbi:MAG: hypothetical protein M3Y77_03425 [Actinomycetota bacterium]|nr:hypothetical protein [Actinomycetota bacterium]